MRGGFVHHRHDPDDPLSLTGNKVRSLLEDRSGTLWVGTTSGLSRHDPLGEGFARYRHDPSDPTSLSHNFVQTILESRDGILWLGTAGGGLNRFDAVFRWRPLKGILSSWVQRASEVSPRRTASPTITSTAFSRTATAGCGSAPTVV